MTILTPAREWPDLTEADQCRLTAWKYTYKLVADGFTPREARHLCFTKYLAQMGRYADDQRAEEN